MLSDILEELRQYPPSGTSYKLLRELSKFGASAEEVIPVVKDVIENHPDPNVRESAKFTLSEIKGLVRKQAPDRIAVMKAVPDEELRKWSWGGFSFPLLWGLAHNQWWVLHKRRRLPILSKEMGNCRIDMAVHPNCDYIIRVDNGMRKTTIQCPPNQPDDKDLLIGFYKTSLRNWCAGVKKRLRENCIIMNVLSPLPARIMNITTI